MGLMGCHALAPENRRSRLLIWRSLHRVGQTVGGEKKNEGRHWSADIVPVATYTVVIVLLLLIWAYVPTR